MFGAQPPVRRPATSTSSSSSGPSGSSADKQTIIGNILQMDSTSSSSNSPPTQHRAFPPLGPAGTSETMLFSIFVIRMINTDTVFISLCSNGSFTLSNRLQRSQTDPAGASPSSSQELVPGWRHGPQPQRWKTVPSSAQTQRPLLFTAAAAAARHDGNPCRHGKPGGDGQSRSGRYAEWKFTEL